MLGTVSYWIQVCLQVADRIDTIPINPSDNQRDELDAMEVFGEHRAAAHGRVPESLTLLCARSEHIRHINDPEHPLTLEQLHVVTVSIRSVPPLRPNLHVDRHAAQLEQISLGAGCAVTVRFTPTIPHCSMATLIGLCIRVKLSRCLPRRYKVSVRIAEGTHSSEAAVNKQLNDKERVAAAMENTHLLEVVNKCLAGSDKAASSIVPSSQSVDALLGALALEGSTHSSAQVLPAAAKLAAITPSQRA